MLAYLAGAIEYAPDLGRGWRRNLTPYLLSLGHQVYDPAEDERKSLTDEERKYLRVWKHSDLIRFQAAVRKIIDFDLDIVSRADYIVCYFDEDVLKGGGTSGELTVAFRKGIPVYMVTPMLLTEVSGWILGCCTRIFADFDDLKRFLGGRYRDAESAGKNGSPDSRQSRLD